MKFKDWTGFVDRYIQMCSVMRGGPDGIDYEEVFEGRGGTPLTRVDSEPGWFRWYPLLWAMDEVLEGVLRSVGEDDFMLWVLFQVEHRSRNEVALDPRCPYSRSLVYSDDARDKIMAVEAALISALAKGGWFR